MVSRHHRRNLSATLAIAYRHVSIPICCHCCHRGCFRFQSGYRALAAVFLPTEITILSLLHLSLAMQGMLLTYLPRDHYLGDRLYASEQHRTHLPEPTSASEALSPPLETTASDRRFLQMRSHQVKRKGARNSKWKLHSSPTPFLLPPPPHLHLSRLQ